ncbi:DUF922 domain-containing protein [Hwangdonia lutea]|uniref:DUF922 domain-containing protein n=1 Tax=Hwangdonia lutea TaxID=3075823 RepID=A0AA97ENB5_9FLAO|nr:DUF922 domain-containing protein [Hwangdonia sp. SCSIO 19198]WOD44091.1 DUF922 domain-containing protein [Hwangdonia sp. SCSIO 19198]
MVKILLILCVFLCVQDEPTLSWNESYKLTWADFKGAANNKVSAVAITASGISFGFSVRETDAEVVSFSTEVFSHFYPEQSWYKSNLADNHVLGHEQLHFDITELHVRKFRQRISLLKVSNHIKNELRQLNKTINKELTAMQDKYDAETNYSRNFENQAKWKSYIANELNKLSKYKSVE